MKLIGSIVFLVMIETISFNTIFKYINLGFVTNLLQEKKDIQYIDSLYQEKEFQKVIQYGIIFLNSDESKDQDYYKCLILTANSYSNIGDFTNAILYYTKAISINKKTNPEELISNYIAIAKIYKKIGKKENYDNAISFLLKANSLGKKIGLPEIRFYEIFNNLGNNYDQIDHLENAQLYHKKALAIAKKTNENEKIHISYINLATLFLDGIETSKNNLIASANYNKMALKYHSKYNYNIFVNLGIINYLQGNTETALEYHNKALEALLDIELKKKSDLPSFSQLQNSNQGKVLKVLYEKTYAWIKLSILDNNKAYFHQALNTVNLADDVLDLVLSQVTDEKSQLYWREQASSFYILGVTICYDLNDSSKALHFIEKNKALLLLNHTLETKLKENIPKHLIAKEIVLKKEYLSLRSKFNLKHSDHLQNILFEKQMSLKSFSDSLKNAFPKYHNLSQKKSIRSLKQIQNNIKKDSALFISYIWDKTENQYDALYGMVISKDTNHLFKIDNLKTFNDKVNQFRALIAKPFLNNKDILAFQNSSFALFEALFPNEDIRSIIKDHKRLVVIPDSDLQNIPFEALIDKKGSSNYLIKNNEISYAYSISYLLENSALKRKQSIDFIGFAPKQFNLLSLENLKNSQKEIDAIQSIIGGKTYMNNEATISNFKKLGNSSKIIHLATHADASTDPWIAFKNKKLNLHELYTYKNQAELVCLSACQTSLGKMSKGEGVFSLARGFFYSGANSVISSLWNVNDKSTQEITTSFYQYLKRGNSKSKALRQAKLDYLNTHALSEASPYYWSSLILIGDNAPIKFSNNNYLFVLLIALFMFILFFSIKNRRKRGNH